MKSKAKWALAGLIIVVLGTLLLVSKKPPPNMAANPNAPPARTQKYTNRSLFRSPEQPSNAATAPQVISGRVYGLDGAAVPGAMVMAKSFAVAGNVATMVASIESDEQGNFQLRVPDGTYQILANKHGYGPSYAHAHVGETVSLVLTPSGTVRGHVYDAKGSPMQHFVIDVLTAGPDHLAAPVSLWTRAFDSPDGSYEVTELPGWAVVLRASARDHAPAFSSPLRIEPAHDAAVDITLSNGCTLEGTVQDANGAPLPFVFVDAESRMQSTGTSELSVDASNRAESDENGRFRLEHAPTGRIALRGYDGDHAPSTVLVDVADCKSAAPINIVMTDGGIITGVARASDGTPIPGARITASQRAIGFVNTIADEQGTFRIDTLPAGKTRLELNHGGQRTSTMVRVEPGAVTQRDITLHIGGSGEIRGKVTAAGTPLAGVQLIIAANRGREHGLDMYFPVTDAEGSYHIRAIPEGQYAVNVVSSGKTEGVDVPSAGVAILNLDVAQRRGQSE